MEIEKNEDEYKKPIIELLKSDFYDLHMGQRRYDWAIKDVHRLLGDIDKLSKDNDEVHPIGEIVIKEYKNEKGMMTKSLIDGQQRWTTILLIISVLSSRVRELLINTDDEKKIEQYKNYGNMLHKFVLDEKLGENNAEKSYRLLVCENDQYIFEKLLDSSEIKEKDIKTISQEKLIDTKKEIEKYLDQFTWEDLQSFIHKLLQRVTVSVSISTKNENSFEIFDKKNSNLKILEESDIVKNMLLEKIKNLKECKDYAIIWENMVNSLTPSKEYRKDLMTRTNTTSFLKYFIMSKGNYINKSGIVKYFRNLKLDSNEVKSLINELNRKSVKYMKFLKGIGNKNISDIKKLGIKQSAIVLLASIDIPQKDFDDISILLEKIGFCSVMGGIKSNKLETLFTEVSKLIQGNKVEDGKEKLNILINDCRKEVIRILINKSFNTFSEKKLAKYILNKVANALDGGEYNEWELEHILIEKKNELTWSECSRYNWFKNDKLYKELVGKIGNLSLLTHSDNSSLKGKSYNDKCEVYKKIKCRLTSSISELISTGTIKTKFDKVIDSSRYNPTQRWGEAEIINRGIWISELVNYIWFGIEVSEDEKYQAK